MSYTTSQCEGETKLPMKHMILSGRSSQREIKRARWANRWTAETLVQTGTSECEGETKLPMRHMILSGRSSQREIKRARWAKRWTAETEQCRLQRCREKY